MNINDSLLHTKKLSTKCRYYPKKHCEALASSILQWQCSDFTLSHRIIYVFHNFFEYHEQSLTIIFNNISDIHTVKFH